MVDSRFFKNRGPMTLQEIIDLSNGKLDASVDRDILVHDVAPLKNAEPNEISFFDNRKYLKDFYDSNAGFCFLTESYVGAGPSGMIPIVCESPYKAFGVISSFFYRKWNESECISSEAWIDNSASIAQSCGIGPGSVIKANVKIGDNTVIGCNTTVADGVSIGENCVIHSNVTLSHCLIGNDVEIFSGARIGQDGFGFAPDKISHVRIPQLGRVIIGNDVQIGANTVIDRGSAPDTVIGNGCRIDNLVHIAHNVVLGRGCIVAGQVGIAGSTHVGDYVMFAGQTGVAGHLTIGAGSRFAVRSGVIRDVPEGVTYGGFPAVPVREWHRQTFLIKALVKKKGATDND